MIAQRRIASVSATLLLLVAFPFVHPADCADYPKPQEGDFLIKDFEFTTGEILPELNLHYTTLGVDHLRLVTGTSMGGMHTWVWGYTYPTFMDALMPLASLPVGIAGRNRMLRKMIIAPLLAINSADDQVNPPELAILEREIKKVRRGRAIVLPITDETRGHGAHSIPAIWGPYLKQLLEESETIE